MTSSSLGFCTLPQALGQTFRLLQQRERLAGRRCYYWRTSAGARVEANDSVFGRAEIAYAGDIEALWRGAGNERAVDSAGRYPG